MISNTYADSWKPITLDRKNNLLPFQFQQHHPITLSVISQISQDIMGCYFVSAPVEVSKEFKKQWESFILEAIYQSLLGQNSYLIIDFGDSEWLSDPVSWDYQKLLPVKITSEIPRLRDVGIEDKNTEQINFNRYLHFFSPYRFNLAATLDSELAKHDAITDGLEQTVSGQGIVTAGVDNLYDIMLKGGQALLNLTDRLINLKRATRQDGVLAYDKNREKIDIQLKNINKEPDVLKVIENRITAITGLPSFLLWGHTDGDGYGVKTSLQLYSQRLTQLSSEYCKLIQLVLELITPDQPEFLPLLEPTNLYPEGRLETIDRMDKLVSALMGLQSIGAITAIEARNTVQADPSYNLVVDPNPQIVTVQPIAETTNTNQASFSG